MDIPTFHGSLYGMQGFEDGKWFQHVFEHSAPESKTAQPRLSITFRLTAHAGSILNFKPDTTKQVYIPFEPKFHTTSFKDMFHEVKDKLTADKGMYGATNNGRMAGEFMCTKIWESPESFVYVYSHKKHFGNAMGPLMTALRDSVSAKFGHPLDWGHVTYYPAGNCKLMAHSDDEPTIQYGSDIFALTFMPNDDVRKINISRITEKELQKRKEKELKKRQKQEKKNESQKKRLKKNAIKHK